MRNAKCLEVKTAGRNRREHARVNGIDGVHLSHHAIHACQIPKATLALRHPQTWYAKARQAFDKPFATHEAEHVSSSGWPCRRLGFKKCSQNALSQELNLLALHHCFILGGLAQPRLAPDRFASLTQTWNKSAWTAV